MNSFELIIENDAPVAAFLSKDISDRQLWIIYSFLPERSFCHPDLAQRWGIDRVITTDDWRSEQLHRKPMFKPKGIKLAFITSTPRP